VGNILRGHDISLAPKGSRLDEAETANPQVQLSTPVHRRDSRSACHKVIGSDTDRIFADDR
jgi:hypothetical protein